jgi:2-acylglycerol O-acyltransferase 2
MLNGDLVKEITVNGTTGHETREPPHAATGIKGDDRSFAEVIKEGTTSAIPDNKQDMEPNGVNGHQGHEVSHEKGTVRQNGSAKKDRRTLRSSRDTNDFEKDENRERSQGYQAAGIRFAPWSIPLKRRLQTLAVLLHSLSIASLVSVFFFLCAIPLTWPILIPYLIHVLISNAATDGRLRYRSEWFRRHRWWKLFAGYFPAVLHKTTDLPPTRKYIFGYHPHGIISHGAFAAFATDALGFSEKFPGITNSLLTLDSNFRVPIYRDYVLALGLRSVSKESIGNILTRGGPNGEGMGRAVTIVVGGARESLEAQPGTLRLILKERKGFIKLAVRTGADLVPVLAFGENDLYDQMNPELHPWLHAIQMFVLRLWKFTLPFLHGRGIFNYDVGLMPYRRPLHIVVGAPIHVAQATGGFVDPAEVDRLHDLYVEELQSIWDRYKDVFAKDRKGELEILK